MQERNKIALTKKQKDIILGTLLGDGYLNKRGTNIRLQLVHGPEQAEYIKFKYDNLKNICTERGLKFETFNDKYSPTGKKHCWNFYTHKHEYLEFLYEKIYPNNKKQISEEILEKLTPLSLAIWLCDDGSLQKRKGKIRKDGSQIYIGARFIICTYSKNINIEKLICKKLKEIFNLNFSIQKHYDNFRLSCTTQEFKKLVEIVNPYIIDSMKYKFDTSFLGKNITS